MKPLPVIRPILVLLLACLPLRAEDEIEKAFRDALYAEEVKGDTEAALKAYQEVAAKFEQQRDMAATALFRQAECLRKLGRKDEAAAMYKKVLAQYGDKERSAKLSRENLAALGMVPDAPSPEAAFTGDAAEVARLEKLLKDSPDLINATDATNPLTAAAEKGQVALVDYLLGKGARVDTLVDGKSALHRAAEAGHLTVCQKLIEKGADVNLSSAAEATALILALDKGRFSIAELLLEKKAAAKAGKLYSFNPGKSQPVGIGNGLQSVQTDPRTSETHYTLTLALERKAPLPLVLRLIEAGADTAGRYRSENSKDDGQNKDIAPLGFAIRGRQLEVVSAILAKDYSPNQAVDGKAWAMDLAMEEAKPSTPEAADDAMVELLRKHGADLKREEVMQKAIEKGLTGYIRAAVKDGASPNRLAKAIEAEKYDALKVLIEAGADPSGEQTEYGDLMTAAVYKESAEAVKTLLDAGYPLKDRLVKVTSVAAWGAFPADRKPNAAARAIYDQMAGEAKKAGVLEEALTKTLTRMLDYSNFPMDTAALLAAGANAAKSEVLSKLFQDQNSQYGLRRSDYMDLWKAARISQNPELRTAVWVSRGPSILEAFRKDHNFFRNQPNRQSFFRSIVQEKGIVPPGTLGRVLAAYGWNADSDELTRLIVYRLDAEGKVQAHAVDFTAIARGGDASKDFPMQWGDVVEIPLRDSIQPGSDSLAEKARREERESVSKFMDGLFSAIDVRLSIGDDQWVVNERNEKGPVFRLGTGRGILGEAGIPGAFSPRAVLKFSAPGVGENTYNGPPSEVAANFVGHGGSVRMETPAREAALSEEALRNAFTLAVSDKGPYLRTFPETMTEILKLPQLDGQRGLELLAAGEVEPASSPLSPPPVMPAGKRLPQELPVRTLRDILLMLHGPNLTGFGPVNWPAAKLRLAKQDGWEDLPLDKADLNWPVVPGMMLILPPLDPAAPIPPDTFDYAACAFDFQITPGDMPPVKLRYQPPVPELKREGDKWLLSWKRKEGDSAFGWPDLYSLLSSVPELKDWPDYTVQFKLPGSGKILNYSKMDLQNNGGLWLQRDWSGIRVDKVTPPPAPPAPAAVPAASQIPRRRVVLPTPLPNN